jgi:hypothetical protein
MADPELEADLKATLAARRELGDEYEDALTKSFLEKLDREVDTRVGQVLAARGVQVGALGAPAAHSRRRDGTGLAVTSIALGIPVSAIVSSNLHGAGSVVGVVVAWAAIAAINVAHSLERRPTR